MLIVLNLLIYLCLTKNIIYIFNKRYTSLTDTSLFNSIVLAKYLVYYTKNIVRDVKSHAQKITGTQDCRVMDCRVRRIIIYGTGLFLH